MRQDGVRDLLALDGTSKAIGETNESVELLTPRQAGLRVGVKLLLLALILLPAHVIAEGLLPSVEDTNLDDLPQFLVDGAIWMLVLAGLARMLYAVWLERGETRRTAESIPETKKVGPGYVAALAPHADAATVTGVRRVVTAEMVGPASVTEGTTSLLGREELRRDPAPPESFDE